MLETIVERAQTRQWKENRTYLLIEYEKERERALEKSFSQQLSAIIYLLFLFFCYLNIELHNDEHDKSCVEHAPLKLKVAVIKWQQQCQWKPKRTVRT